MYSSSNELRNGPQSSFVPRFLTSAPLMYRLSNLNHRGTVDDFGLSSTLNNPAVNTPTPTAFGHTILPTSIRLLPSHVSEWNSGVSHSPYASSSVLGAPISNFSSPGSTVVNLLPVIQLPCTGAQGSRIPFREVNGDLSGARDEADPPLQWKLAKPVSEAPREGVSFENRNATLSSRVESGESPQCEHRRSVSKPRGELVGLRVNQIEDHIRRQSTARQPVSTIPKAAVSN